MSQKDRENSDRATARVKLMETAEARANEVVEVARALVNVPSENPPGDTRRIADVAVSLIQGVRGSEVEKIESSPPVMNVLARLRSRKSGRRLVFNSHLDTFPAGDRNRWTVDPFSGEVRDGRLFGRGASDMKGGLAASLFAFILLSEFTDWWNGELVLTLAGDEETMGTLGTGFLLANHSRAMGDAMICGDAGSPSILRFGEKGLLWLKLEATGRVAHGAHVHLGENAIERLLEAMRRLVTLREFPVETPPEVSEAIRSAAPRSESVSGPGESGVLTSVTVNFGVISGGTAPNLVADRASTYVDIRLPVGVTVDEIVTEIDGLIGGLAGISYEAVNRYDATWTPPEHEIVRTTSAACEEIFGEAPVSNMRVGASDSRHYRSYGVPTVVCGATPHGMGNADEYVEVAELEKLARVFTLAAFDYLSQ